MLDSHSNVECTTKSAYKALLEEAQAGSQVSNNTILEPEINILNTISEPEINIQSSKTKFRFKLSKQTSKITNRGEIGKIMYQLMPEISVCSDGRPANEDNYLGVIQKAPPEKMQFCDPSNNMSLGI